MSSLRRISIFLLVIAVAQAVNLCSCPDYTTKEACGAIGSCWWSAASNQCQEDITDCTEALIAGDCKTPFCQWTNQKCQAFVGCTALTGSVKQCKDFGCLPTKETGNGPCADFPGCDAITSPQFCQLLTDAQKGMHSGCLWKTTDQVDNLQDPTGTTGTCVEVFECKSVPAYACSLWPYCSLKDAACVDLDCTLYGNDKANCKSKMNACVWTDNAAGAAGEGTCVANDCSKIKTSPLCLSADNNKYCAWKNEVCTTCVLSMEGTPQSGSGSQILLIASLALIIVVNI